MSRLTTIPRDPILDLDPWVGQRSVSYRFNLVNGTTGQNLGEITPLRNGTLSHDSSRLTARSLSLSLGVADTAAINMVTDRIDLTMVVGGDAEYPLGRYMFTVPNKQVFTSGDLSSVTLTDQMFIIDQQLEAAYSANGKNTTSALQEVFAQFPFVLDIEASPYSSVEAWGIGSTWGTVISALALTGDYFNPWFGNDGNIHAIRSFDPATRIPDFDFDSGSKVIRDGILETNDLLTAPNRFIVVSNAPLDPTLATTGTADVPITAPHSIANRGFVIPDVRDLQIGTSTQAYAVAANLALRQTVAERTSLSTVPDPRHDSLNVIAWRDALWLEISWSLDLAPGGIMTNVLRKAYA